MKLFNTHIKIAQEKADRFGRLLADRLQDVSKKISLKVQRVLLICFCLAVIVYCVLLILQPFIN